MYIYFTFSHVLSSVSDIFSPIQNFDEKFHNVSQSFELMMDAGLAKPKARPEGEEIDLALFLMMKLFRFWN